MFMSYLRTTDWLTGKAVAQLVNCLEGDGQTDAGFEIQRREVGSLMHDLESLSVLISRYFRVKV